MLLLRRHYASVDIFVTLITFMMPLMPR